MKVRGFRICTVSMAVSYYPWCKLSFPIFFSIGAMMQSAVSLSLRLRWWCFVFIFSYSANDGQAVVIFHVLNKIDGHKPIIYHIRPFVPWDKLILIIFGNNSLAQIHFRNFKHVLRRARRRAYQI